MKNIFIKMKKVPLIAYIITAVILIALAVVLVLCLSEKNEPVTLKILEKNCTFPMTIRMLENIGFETNDANSGYDLKEGEESVEFTNITYSFKNKYNSEVDPETIPEDDGMTAIVDFTKTKTTRTINKITFPVDKNNGEYIALNGLYLKDMDFDSIVKTFGEEYETVSGKASATLLTKKVIQYKFENYTLEFEFSQKKLIEFSMMVPDYQPAETPIKNLPNGLLTLPPETTTGASE